MLLKETESTHSICEHPKCTNIAVQGCITCRKALCKTHLDALHEFYPEHTATTVAEYLLQSSELCEEHGMTLSSYCVTDNKLLCPTCYHSCLLEDHILIPLKQLVERGKHLCSLPHNDEIFQQEKLVLQLSKEEQELNSETSKCIDKVQEKFSSIRKMLDEKEAALMAAITDKADKKSKQIASDKEETTKLVGALKLLLDPENVHLAVSNPSSQLKYAKAFKTFKAALNEKQPQASSRHGSNSKEQEMVYKFNSEAFNTMSTITRSLEQMKTSVTLEKTAPKTLQAVMLGLDGAGKTALLYRLKLAEFSEDHSPTIGFNQEVVYHGEVALQIDDVGGQEKMRPLWKNFIKADTMVIFVLDASDYNPKRIKEARQELHNVISMIRQANTLASRKKNPFVLVFGNKQDNPTAVGVVPMIENLDLKQLKDVDWYVQPCSAVMGFGIHEGIEEALQVLTEN